MHEGTQVNHVVLSALTVAQVIQDIYDVDQDSSHFDFNAFLARFPQLVSMDIRELVSRLAAPSQLAKVQGMTETLEGKPSVIGQVALFMLDHWDDFGIEDLAYKYEYLHGAYVQLSHWFADVMPKLNDWGLSQDEARSLHHRAHRFLPKMLKIRNQLLSNARHIAPYESEDLTYDDLFFPFEIEHFLARLEGDLPPEKLELKVKSLLSIIQNNPLPMIKHHEGVLQSNAQTYLDLYTNKSESLIHDVPMRVHFNPTILRLMGLEKVKVMNNQLLSFEQRVVLGSSMTDGVMTDLIQDELILALEQVSREQLQKINEACCQIMDALLAEDKSLENYTLYFQMLFFAFRQLTQDLPYYQLKYIDNILKHFHDVHSMFNQDELAKMISADMRDDFESIYINYISDALEELEIKEQAPWPSESKGMIAGVIVRAMQSYITRAVHEDELLDSVQHLNFLSTAFSTFKHWSKIEGLNQTEQYIIHCYFDMMLDYKGALRQKKEDKLTIEQWQSHFQELGQRVTPEVYEQLKGQWEAAKEELAELKKKSGVQGKTISQLQEAQSKLKASCKALSNKNLKLQNQIKAKEAHISQFEETRKIASKEMDKLTDALEHLQLEVNRSDELKAKLKESECQNEDLQQQLEPLVRKAEKVGALEKQFKQTQVDFEATKAELAKAKSYATQSEEKTERLSNQLQEVMQDYQQLKKQPSREVPQQSSKIKNPYVQLIAQQQIQYLDKTHHLILPQEMKSLLNALEAKGHKAFVYGGYVRMLFTQAPTQNLNIVTTCPLAEAQQLLKGFSQDPIKQKTLEQRNPKHQQVVCMEDLDLLKQSRKADLTMNAVFVDAKGHVYDPTGCGKVDLLNRDFNIPPKNGRDLKTFWKQDPSRILRLLRLASELGRKLPQPMHFEACKQLDKLQKNMTFIDFKNALYGLFCFNPLRTMQTLVEHDCFANLIGLKGFNLEQRYNPLLSAFMEHKLDKSTHVAPDVLLALFLMFELDQSSATYRMDDSEKALANVINHYLKRWKKEDWTKEESFYRIYETMKTLVPEYNDFAAKKGYTPNFKKRPQTQTSHKFKSADKPRTRQVNK